MKRIAALFISMICLTFVSTAQDNKDKVNAGAPEIVFDKELHDFGTIDYAGDGTYSFRFTNTGKEPLIITDAKGSCGCTVPKWPKEPILKGQSNSINVTYDTKRPGPFTKTVTINSNAKTPSKVLTIKGVVRSMEQTEDVTPVRKDNGMSPLENSK